MHDHYKVHRYSTECSYYFVLWNDFVVQSVYPFTGLSFLMAREKKVLSKILEMFTQYLPTL